MTEAEKIADSLTEVQRGAVLGKTRFLKHAEACQWPMCGTVRRMLGVPHKWEATPLGLEVRKVLEQRA